MVSRDMRHLSFTRGREEGAGALRAARSRSRLGAAHLEAEADEMEHRGEEVIGR